MIRPGPMSTRRPRPEPDALIRIQPERRSSACTADRSLGLGRPDPGALFAAIDGPQPSTRKMQRVEH